MVIAISGCDGKVRDVMMQYKITKPGSDYKGQNDSVSKRSAHKLVVILPVEEQDC